MPKNQSPYPCKFPIRLTQEDNDNIFMLAVREGITPGRWARRVLHKAIVDVLEREKSIPEGE